MGFLQGSPGVVSMEAGTTRAIVNLFISTASVSTQISFSLLGGFAVDRILDI